MCICMVYICEVHICVYIYQPTYVYIYGIHMWGIHRCIYTPTHIYFDIYFEVYIFVYIWHKCVRYTYVYIYGIHTWGISMCTHMLYICEVYICVHILVHFEVYICVYRWCTYVRYTYVYMHIVIHMWGIHTCTYIGALRGTHMYISKVYICEVYICAYIL